MTFNRHVLAAVLACAPLAAQAAETSYTFDNVTGIEHRGSEVRLTGVLVNDTLPSTVALPSFGGGGHYDRCARAFESTLSLPGMYNLTVVVDTLPPPSPTPVVFVRCSLTLKP
jgi:hypothetical protein